MLRPTERELRAMVALKSNEEFKVLLDMFKRHLFSLDVENRSVHDERQFRWNQGKLQLLDDIVTKIEDSKVSLDYLTATGTSRKNPNI